MGRVAFLARVSGIREMVEAGYPLLTIYQQHESDIGISYSQFSRYVARYIRSHKRHDQLENNRPAPAPSAQPEQHFTGAGPSPGDQQPAKSGKPDKPGKSSFSHNATSGNNRNDLI